MYWSQTKLGMVTEVPEHVLAPLKRFGMRPILSPVKSGWGAENVGGGVTGLPHL